MASKEEIWQAFVKVNNLTITGADFASRQKKYSGLGYVSVPQDEFMKKIEFAGFVDGFVGNPHREQGPQGSLVTKPEQVIDNLLGRVEFDLSKIDGLQEMAEQLKQQGMEDVPQVKYDRQYTLGSSMRQ